MHPNQCRVTTMCVYNVCILVCCCLATEVFVDKLLAKGGVWVIIGRLMVKGVTSKQNSYTTLNRVHSTMRLMHIKDIYYM